MATSPNLSQPKLSAFEALVHREKNWVRMIFFFLSGFGMDGRDGWMGVRNEGGGRRNRGIEGSSSEILV